MRVGENIIVSGEPVKLYVTYVFILFSVARVIVYSSMERVLLYIVLSYLHWALYTLPYVTLSSVGLWVPWEIAQQKYPCRLIRANLAVATNITMHRSTCVSEKEKAVLLYIVYTCIYRYVQYMDISV